MRETTIFFNTIAFKISRNFKALLFIFVLLAQSNLFSGQIISNYLFSQSVGTYTPVTGGTEVAVAVDNSAGGNLSTGVYSILLPFDFKFNNITYLANTAFNVSAKGFLTFGAAVPATTLTAPLGNTGSFEGVISPFAGNSSSFASINGVTGKIKTEVRGTSPNRVFVIEWQNFRPSSSTSTTAVYALSYQAQLFETTNNVAFVYSSGSNLIGTTSSGASKQVGLRGSTTADFLVRSNASTQLFSSSILSTTSGDYQQIHTVNSPPGMPDSGLTYLFEAPSCFPPSGIIPTMIGYNSISLSWTSSASNPADGYDVYFSTSSTAPTSSTVLTASNSASATGNSVSISGLATGTKYYFWMRSRCTTTDIGTWNANPVAISTACLPVAAFYENFDGYNSTVILRNTVPDCWFLNIPQTSPGTQYTHNTYVNSTPNNIYLQCTTAQTPVVLVMPEFSNVNSGTHRVRFFARVSSTGGSGLNVGYMTNAADLNTFNPLGIIQPTSTLSEYTLDIPNTVPAGARLAIKNSSDGKTYYLDDLYWEDALLATNETLNGKKELIFYPNPFTDYVNINTEKAIDSFVISDISGRTVKTVKNPSGKVYLGDLKSGLYFVKVKFEDGKTETYKALKKD